MTTLTPAQKKVIKAMREGLTLVRKDLYFGIREKIYNNRYMLKRGKMRIRDINPITGDWLNKNGLIKQTDSYEDISSFWEICTLTERGKQIEI